VSKNTFLKNKIEFDFEEIAVYLFAFYYLINILKFSFEKINEKLDMMYLLKEILSSVVCYLRIDLRVLIEKIYSKILGIPVIGLNQSNNVEVLLNNAYGNKHMNNFMSRRYADETWLYSFIKDDRKGIYSLLICLKIYFFQLEKIIFNFLL